MNLRSIGPAHKKKEYDSNALPQNTGASHFQFLSQYLRAANEQGAYQSIESSHCNFLEIGALNSFMYSKILDWNPNFETKPQRPELLDRLSWV